MDCVPSKIEFTLTLIVTKPERNRTEIMAQTLEEVRQILLDTADSYSDTGLLVDRNQNRISILTDKNVSSYQQDIIEILLETAHEYSDVGIQVNQKLKVISINMEDKIHQLVFEIGQKHIDLKITQ